MKTTLLLITVRTAKASPWQGLIQFLNVPGSAVMRPTAFGCMVRMKEAALVSNGLLCFRGGELSALLPWIILLRVVVNSAYCCGRDGNGWNGRRNPTLLYDDNRTLDLDHPHNNQEQLGFDH